MITQLYCDVQRMTLSTNKVPGIGATKDLLNTDAPGLHAATTFILFYVFMSPLVLMLGLHLPRPALYLQREVFALRSSEGDC